MKYPLINHFEFSPLVKKSMFSNQAKLYTIEEAKEYFQKKSINYYTNNKYVDQIEVTKGLSKDNWADFYIKFGANQIPKRIRIIVEDINISAQEIKAQLFGEFYFTKAATKIQREFHQFQAKMDKDHALGTRLISRKERAIIHKIAKDVLSYYQTIPTAEFKNGNINVDEMYFQTRQARENLVSGHVLKKTGNCTDLAHLLYTRLLEHPELSQKIKDSIRVGKFEGEDHGFVIICDELYIDIWFKFLDLVPQEGLRDIAVRSTDRDTFIFTEKIVT